MGLLIKGYAGDNLFGRINAAVYAMKARGEDFKEKYSEQKTEDQKYLYLQGEKMIKEADELSEIIKGSQTRFTDD